MTRVWGELNGKGHLVGGRRGLDERSDSGRSEPVQRGGNISGEGEQKTMQRCARLDYV